jgi:hypothetical protein
MIQHAEQQAGTAKVDSYVRMYYAATNAVESPSCQESSIVVYFIYDAYTLCVVYTIFQFVLPRLYDIYGHIESYTYIYIYAYIVN